MTDMLEPGVLFSSLLISMIGLGMFLYGKKSERPMYIFGGLAMSTFPYFVHNPMMMWVVAGLILILMVGVLPRLAN